MPRSLNPILCLMLLATGGCTAPKAPPLKPGASGHIVIGPYVQPGTDPELAKGMRLVWWTDVSGPATLEYRGKDGQGGTVQADEAPMEGLFRHTASLPGLEAGREFEVQAGITLNGTSYTSRKRWLRVPGSKPNSPFRFAALGDTGAGTDAQKRVVIQMTKQKPELLLITGDVAYNSGDFAEYRSRFFPYYDDFMATAPILPALGNHDVGNPGHLGKPFREVWTPPQNWAPPKGSDTIYTILKRRANKGEGPLPRDQWSLRNYSVSAGACHFLCLDSTADQDTLRDLVVPWAKADLAKARASGAKWLIAFWHHPPYTHGAYRDNVLQWRDMRELLVPVMKEAGVQFVLNGHDHNYQRMYMDGIHYIVTGAGGARLYPVKVDYTGNGQPPLLSSNDEVRSFTLFELSPNTGVMKVRQIDENGRTLDAFEVKERQ